MAPAVRAVLATGLSAAVFCPLDQKSFWESVPNLSVLTWEKKSRDVTASLRGNWEAAMVWETGPAADMLAAAAIPRRLGPASLPKLRKRLTHPLAATPGALDHRVRFYLCALEEMGIAVDRPEFFAPIPFNPAQDSQTVLLSPDSDFGRSHEWPLDRWCELGQMIAADGRRVAVARIRDKGQAESLARALTCDRVDAMQLGEVFPSLQPYRHLVAADGYLPHLAAHCGLNCITLFGPNDPVWKRPLGKQHTVICRHVECGPCLSSKCPLDLRCQHELTAEQVIHRVREALSAV
ncbi:MAG: glycosyltransferase family 9 protein [Luteolibacter sp.]